MRVFDISPEMPPAATGGISIYNNLEILYANCQLRQVR